VLAPIAAILLGALVALMSLLPFAEVDPQVGAKVGYQGTPWSLLVLLLAVALVVLGVRAIEPTRRMGSLVPLLAMIGIIVATVAGMATARDHADHALASRPAFFATSNFSSAPALIIFVAFVAAGIWTVRAFVLLIQRNSVAH
jgi:amino acid transporter